MNGEDRARPNIILILADDMGFADVGCYGAEIATRNIDQLSYDGLRLTQIYNNVRCCPTRASLLTGLYPTQTGLGYMARDQGITPYQGYLNNNCFTIAEALRPSGYRTGMSGKWHVGGLYSADSTTMTSAQCAEIIPASRGFERSFGILGGATSYYHPRTLFQNNERIDMKWKDRYLTDAITDYAVDMIDDFSKGSDPFFLYVAYTAPHWPLHALPEDIEKYRNNYLDGWDALRERQYERQKTLGVVDPGWPFPPRDEHVSVWADLTPDRKRWEDARMAAYAAQIDRMDQGIGRVIAKLRELEIERNTLTIFLSDNGASEEESVGPIHSDPEVIPRPADTFQSYGQSWANDSNTPFERYKKWTQEGCLSTPCIAHWPVAIESNIGYSTSSMSWRRAWKWLEHNIGESTRVSQ